MMDEHERRFVMIIMAAIGGSVVSLWSLDWKRMSWKEIVMTVSVGIAFSIFGVPWIAADWFHVDIMPLRVACGMTFFGAAFGIVLIPILKSRAEAIAKSIPGPRTGDDA